MLVLISLFGFHTAKYTSRHTYFLVLLLIGNNYFVFCSLNLLQVERMFSSLVCQVPLITTFFHVTSVCVCMCMRACMHIYFILYALLISVFIMYTHSHTIDCVIYTGYSFLATNYNLLYQSIIPNCRLTINKLRKHYELSDDVERYVLEGSSSRIRCQRLLNLMLDTLNADRDYMKFCYLLFLSTSMTDLPLKMILSKNFVYWYNAYTATQV